MSHDFAGGLWSQALQPENINSLLSLPFCSSGNGKELTLLGPGTNFHVYSKAHKGHGSSANTAAQLFLGP